MLSTFLSPFVGHPLRILALAGAYAVVWAVLRRGPAGRRANAMAAPTLCCAAFALWEWVVLTRTPGADIRVDLLLIWPTLLLLSGWAAWRVGRR